MDTGFLFALSFPLAAPFWALMIFAPGWSVTRRVVASPLPGRAQASAMWLRRLGLLRGDGAGSERRGRPR